MRRYLRLLLCLPLLATTACAADSIAGPAIAPEPEPEAGIQAPSAPGSISIRLDCTRSNNSPGTAPIYIIDGAITFSAQVIESLKAEDILSVEVIKVHDEGSYYENLPKRSVVIITTHAAASRRR